MDWHFQHGHDLRSIYAKAHLHEAALKLGFPRTVAFALGHLALATFGIAWFVTISFYALKPNPRYFSAQNVPLSGWAGGPAYHPEGGGWPTQARQGCE